MRLHHVTGLLLAVSLSSAASTSIASASEVSWMFQPGYYTHSPVTGKRVAQYEPERPSYVTVDPTYQESGYRHQLIQNGTDWLNLVQTWGAGTAIRPYGEWEYPYRAGATPFGPWGNPQGPWTLPFDSWQNPYGLNRLPYNMPWRQGNGGGNPGGDFRTQPYPQQYSQPGPQPWQGGGQPSPQTYSQPWQGGAINAPGGNPPPLPAPPGPQGP